jgi:hypothetical protein
MSTPHNPLIQVVNLSRPRMLRMMQVFSEQPIDLEIHRQAMASHDGLAKEIGDLTHAMTGEVHRWNAEAVDKPVPDFRKAVHEALLVVQAAEAMRIIAAFMTHFEVCATLRVMANIMQKPYSVSTTRTTAQKLLDALEGMIGGIDPFREGEDWLPIYPRKFLDELRELALKFAKAGRDAA